VDITLIWFREGAPHLLHTLLGNLDKLVISHKAYATGTT
jgi:hypothetical protein